MRVRLPVREKSLVNVSGKLKATLLPQASVELLPQCGETWVKSMWDRYRKWTLSELSQFLLVRAIRTTAIGMLSHVKLKKKKSENVCCWLKKQLKRMIDWVILLWEVQETTLFLNFFCIYIANRIVCPVSENTSSFMCFVFFSISWCCHVSGKIKVVICDIRFKKKVIKASI